MTYDEMMAKCLANYFSQNPQARLGTWELAQQLSDDPNKAVQFLMRAATNKSLYVEDGETYKAKMRDGTYRPAVHKLWRYPTAIQLQASIDELQAELDRRKAMIV